MNFRLAFLSLAFLCSCQNSLNSNQLEAFQANEIIGGEEIPFDNPLTTKVLSIKSLRKKGTKIKDGRLQTEYTAQQCTAVAVSPKVLLTAAHCFTNNDDMRRVEIALPNGDTQVIRTSRIEIHPDYNDETLKADLALAVLEIPLPGQIKILKLPEADVDLKLTSILAAGFGRTNSLRSEENSSGILHAVELNVLEYSPTSPLFLSDQTSGKGICHGDSGGPALLEREDGTYVVGVVSSVRYTSKENDCGYRGEVYEYSKVYEVVKTANPRP